MSIIIFNNNNIFLLDIAQINILMIKCALQIYQLSRVPKISMKLDKIESILRNSTLYFY